MMTYKASVSVHSIIFVALSFVSFSASAQKVLDIGVKSQIIEIREHLIRIEDGVDKLQEIVDELASADRSICDRPISWNRTLPDDERFVPALNGGAHCDLETGLIWMETPIPNPVSWKLAFSICRAIEVDGRKGWNLPTVEQLATLIDSENIFPGPALPLGHPFKGSLDEAFWTSSLREPRLVGQTQQTWLVDFGFGIPVRRLGIGIESRAWCIRGAGGSPPITEISFIGED